MGARHSVTSPHAPLGGGVPPRKWPHFRARCPRSWSGAEDRSEPIRGWVSEDRRSPAARWGAWAPKVRHPFGITHLVSRSVAQAVWTAPSPLPRERELDRVLYGDEARIH